jgi:hypothetical protein
MGAFSPFSAIERQCMVFVILLALAAQMAGQKEISTARKFPDNCQL